MTEVLSSQGDWAGNVWAQSGCGIDTCEDCKRLLAFHLWIAKLIKPPAFQMSTTTPPLFSRPIGKSTACAYTLPSSSDVFILECLHCQARIPLASCSPFCLRFHHRAYTIPQFSYESFFPNPSTLNDTVSPGWFVTFTISILY